MQLPRVYSIPSWATSAGTEVIDLMNRVNRPLDPWQQWVVLNGLGQVADPETARLELAASRCGCWIPRQNGKGEIIMALELGWLFLFGERLTIHSAHEYRTAQEAFIRIRNLVRESPDLDPLVNRYWQANGEQGLELVRSMKSARLRFMSRTRGAGRGFSARKVVLDEAQELIAAQMAAILPVVAAQDDWQIWFFGTPPRPEDDDAATSDAWIYNLKEAGESRAPRLMWLDWGIETVDFDDPAQVAALRDPQTWKRANPAMDIRIHRQTIEDELSTLGPTRAFAMERCGMWLPRSSRATDRVIPQDKWEAGILPVHARRLPSDLAIAFHVNTKRTHATIGFAGQVDGVWNVGLLGHRVGTDWLLDELVSLVGRLNPVAVTVDVKSETTVRDLAKEGISLPVDPDRPARGDLILPAMADVATAYGMMVDAAKNGTLRHHDEPPLNRAILAPGRPLAGGMTWDHRRGIEVGPAIVVGLAMWAYRERIDKVKSTYNPEDNIW